MSFFNKNYCQKKLKIFFDWQDQLNILTFAFGGHVRLGVVIAIRGDVCPDFVPRRVVLYNLVHPHRSLLHIAGCQQIGHRSRS